MALFRGRMKFKAWQAQSVEDDGQLGQGAVPQLVSDMVVPSAVVSKEPNPCAIMYHPWCNRT
jgi:hypothetical protein